MENNENKAAVQLKGVKRILTRSIGPRPLKLWVLIVIIVVVVAAVGTYFLLSKPASGPISSSSVSSVLGGSWSMTNSSSGNGTDYPGGAFPTLSSYFTANYTNGNERLQMVALDFMNSNYADSEFSFLSAFSIGANSTGTIDGGPYVYVNTVATTGIFATPASSDIVAQHNSYVVLFESQNFNFNLQQAKNLVSDQVGEL